MLFGVKGASNLPEGIIGCSLPYLFLVPPNSCDVYLCSYWGHRCVLARGPDQIIPNKQCCSWHLQSWAPSPSHTSQGLQFKSLKCRRSDRGLSLLSGTLFRTFPRGKKKPVGGKNHQTRPLSFSSCFMKWRDEASHSPRDKHIV